MYTSDNDYGIAIRDQIRAFGFTLLNLSTKDRCKVISLATLSMRFGGTELVDAVGNALSKVIGDDWATR